MPKGKQQTRHQRLANARAEFMREQRRFDTLQAYFDRTQPKSREDFVGREHFIEYANVANLRPARLHKALVLGRLSTGNWDYRVTDPSEYGLVVEWRKDTPLSDYPVDYLRPQAGDSGMEQVIQVGSLIDSAANIAKLDLFDVSPSTMSLLGTLSIKIAGFIEQTKSPLQAS